MVLSRDPMEVLDQQVMFLLQQELVLHSQVLVLLLDGQELLRMMVFTILILTL